MAPRNKSKQTVDFKLHRSQPSIPYAKATSKELGPGSYNYDPDLLSRKTQSPAAFARNSFKRFEADDPKHLFSSLLPDLDNVAKLRRSEAHLKKCSK